MSEPKIESVAGYQKGQEPAAAAFGKGAVDRAGIERAAEARREHSRELGNRPTTPRGAK
jgi:hypothetical protein